MKIKNFEDYAKRVETFNSVFEGTVKETADKMTKGIFYENQEF